MLFGSLSAAAGSMRRASTLGAGFTGCTSGLAGARLSTAAGFCSSGVVVQPASTMARLAAVRLAAVSLAIARMIMTPFFLLEERPPRRFAHVACRRAQALLDAAVGRHRRKHSATVDHRGEQDHAAVRREARRFALVAVGDDLGLAVCEIEQRHLEFVAVARDVRERPAVRAGRGVT